ncbi:ATP-binding cassette domain-containing protein [Ascidiaceihabitans sp.]|uniref:ABC transporter ATP-binding protein n=1 Tax=Ascidiaceihabitans sp. TaxID=1872644 RepID=UPI0032970834
MPARLILKGVEVSLADRERRFTLSVPDLSIGAGEAVGLTGPSGTGKTLMLELLGLLRRPSSVRAFGISSDRQTLDLASVWTPGAQSPAQVRADMFGFVPQSGGLLPFLSVTENIHLAQSISGREDVAWQDHLVGQLGLGDVRQLRPGSLSIGQRQRVAIARALAHRPAFVIADEPTAALDPGAASTAMGLLIDVAATGGAGVIISSHDLALLDQFPMRRVALELVSAPGAAEARSQLMHQEVLA